MKPLVLIFLTSSALLGISAYAHAEVSSDSSRGAITGWQGAAMNRIRGIVAAPGPDVSALSGEGGAFTGWQGAAMNRNRAGGRTIVAASGEPGFSASGALTGWQGAAMNRNRIRTNEATGGARSPGGTNTGSGR
jgi:hypothetical protein